MELVLYNAARTALQRAVRVDEVKSIRDRAEAMRAYGKQANDRQMEADAFEIRERATKRLGELVKAQKALPREEGGGLNRGAMPKGTKRDGPRGKAIAGPNPTRNSGAPSLQDMGIDKHLADRARKLEKMPEAKFEKHIEIGRERVFAVDKAHVGHATGESEWYTPKEYIAAARRVMGGIDLDPASCTIANRVVGATKFYSEEDDGLAQPWSGRVWMNPPYSQPALARFTDNLKQHVMGGKVTEAIVLVNNATETTWFQDLALGSTAVCFPKGRVRFWHPDRESAPLQGQALLYFGEAGDLFIKAFEPFGVYALWRGSRGEDLV